MFSVIINDHIDELYIDYIQLLKDLLFMIDITRIYRPICFALITSCHKRFKKRNISYLILILPLQHYNMQF